MDRTCLSPDGAMDKTSSETLKELVVRSKFQDRDWIPILTVGIQQNFRLKSLDLTRCLTTEDYLLSELIQSLAFHPSLSTLRLKSYDRVETMISLANVLKSPSYYNLN
jgi:hypothetical protein